MRSAQNVGGIERWASALGGAALTIFGIRQRSVAGAMIAASGGVLMVRGATGHFPWNASNGPRPAATDTRTALGGPGGVLVEYAATINRNADELFRFWRKFENLPRFMRHLKSVRQLDQQRSHWVAEAPAGRTVEWEAEIINEIPNELIAWRTLDRSEVVSAGSVRFRALAADRGTEVHVRLQYDPPGGKAGATIARLFGRNPSQTIQEDVRRFKQLMETGEMPTTQGQPRGKQSILNYD